MRVVTLVVCVVALVMALLPGTVLAGRPSDKIPDTGGGGGTPSYTYFPRYYTIVETPMGTGSYTRALTIANRTYGARNIVRGPFRYPGSKMWYVWAKR